MHIFCVSLLTAASVLTVTAAQPLAEVASRPHKVDWSTYDRSVFRRDTSQKPAWYKYPLVQYASAGLGVGLGMIGVDYLRARNRNPDPDTGFGRMEEFKAVLDYNTNDIIKANLCVTLAIERLYGIRTEAARRKVSQYLSGRIRDAGEQGEIATIVEDCFTTQLRERFNADDTQAEPEGGPEREDNSPENPTMQFALLKDVFNTATKYLGSGASRSGRGAIPHPGSGLRAIPDPRR